MWAFLKHGQFAFGVGLFKRRRYTLPSQLLTFNVVMVASVTTDRAVRPGRSDACRNELARATSGNGEGEEHDFVLPHSAPQPVLEAMPLLNGR
jgi:hypothetical protein